MNLRKIAARSRAVSLMLALFFTATAHGQLFESDSKRFSGTKMDIVVKEIERRERTSVIAVTIQRLGSSVGSWFFLLCSIHQLALERGNFRYIVKVEEQPKPGQMIVGFLREASEDPASLGAEFTAIDKTKTIIDLAQFAPICDAMK
jgi:hypothetical protein